MYRCECADVNILIRLIAATSLEAVLGQHVGVGHHSRARADRLERAEVLAERPEGMGGGARLPRAFRYFGSFAFAFLYLGSFVFGVFLFLEFRFWGFVVLGVSLLEVSSSATEAMVRCATAGQRGSCDRVIVYLCSGAIARECDRGAGRQRTTIAKLSILFYYSTTIRLYYYTAMRLYHGR